MSYIAASAQAVKSRNPGDVQEAYIEQKDRLLNAIDSTKSILGDLRDFSKNSWVVRYPQLQEQPHEGEPSRRKSCKGMRRSLSFPDDPNFQADVVINTTGAGTARSVTLASIADAEAEPETAEDEDDHAADSADFHVFRLDLKLGAHGSSSSPATLVSQLEKSSIANLLDERISTAVNHMDRLRLRVEDTSSKVLVTGDLNAGKSTFVNALLRREIMPIDQQPCTTAFCEVHDSVAENGGKEEVHVLKQGVSYSIDDESTFTRASLSDLETIISENEDEHQILKIYLSDTRDPASSLLSNGIVNISLIDAPGLNRDLVNTTAVFARQEEIDVVVFVVSAENHFTLSAKEFLTTASKEKAYIFIVVNKYEQIRDKAKCRRLVLEQIKQLSPATYKDAEDLVHFVDSHAAAENGTPAFDNLESSLRSFVLVKRSKSKLAPASTYLHHILSDVDLLVGANAIVAETELERAREDLNRAGPVLDKMKNGREKLEDGLEMVEEEGVATTLKRTKEFLTDALERVGQGQLGVDQLSLSMPSYPGLLGIWDYVKDVRRVLLTSLDVAVKVAEDEARLTTVDGVNRIGALADEHLPEGVERKRRVFMPEAMFRPDKTGRRKTRRMSSGAIVAGGTYGLGIGLAQRSDMLEATFLDIFDVHNYFWVQFGDGKLEKVEGEQAVTALGVASVGVGALTMVGGKVLGARGLVEGVIRLCDLWENETARKWAAPVLGAATIGLGVYFVLELPSTIPRTVGRRIKASLVQDGEKGEESTFVGAHALRVSRETRKVLRLASWDVKELFRAAMDVKSREVQGAEEMKRKAGKAVEQYATIERRTGEVRKLVLADPA
ncbi:hypothetical protein POSPLADRAFT_1076376 [Postia placenta MAD-698-R-SB12]|uniref:Dynamin-type G domain-containing protein n=1 Tax=Postia placenta MAD-698-R-SB12 TaxID=670580 RepID=A0A1X6MLC6_9APHY|nr:hypothetical protein POSPLADRAFT_1076376 [Postia placenta MAD-698-R-SB12]OSX57165.1 hypothetical protein POSPLADRAFT_1076376 [Postia placenta MAD-698-R-SB12]